ncbi:MAG: SDR family oxidoreductase [Flavobacterium sp.]
MKQISILGCGWLGLPLAKALLEQGFSVNGSTTSTNKLSEFENLGIHAFLISLSAHQTEGDIFAFLENSEILIIDIPPKLRGAEKENFVNKIEILIPFIEESSIKKVLFVSSTSVYSDDNSIVTEDTKPQPDTESGKQLLEAEALLQSNKNFQTTVVRFGGLIGEDRHPINFLAGRNNLENPNGPINLIHQKDCIGIILRIIEKECWNETFNAVAPFHPTREEYYTQKAIELNLALPEFNLDRPSVGKTILSKKIEKVLDYNFMITNL